MSEEQQPQEEQPKENPDETKFFELIFRKLSDDDLDKILEEIELMKDGAVSIFSCIIFLKKMIYSGTKEKFQRIVKREGRDSNDYNRKKRPYSAQEKNRYGKMINKILKYDPDCGSRIPIDEIKKNEDMNIYNKYENLNKNIEGAKK